MSKINGFYIWPVKFCWIISRLSVQAWGKYTHNILRDETAHIATRKRLERLSSQLFQTISVRIIKNSNYPREQYGQKRELYISNSKLTYLHTWMPQSVILCSTNSNYFGGFKQRDLSPSLYSLHMVCAVVGWVTRIPDTNHRSKLLIIPKLK